MNTTAKRIPYQQLTPTQRDDIHAWCREHGINEQQVPINTEISHDPATGEWELEQYVRGEKGIVYDPTTGGPKRTVVRVRATRPLPWPTVAPVRFQAGITR